MRCLVPKISQVLSISWVLPPRIYRGVHGLPELIVIRTVFMFVHLVCVVNRFFRVISMARKATVGIDIPAGQRSHLDLDQHGATWEY